MKTLITSALLVLAANFSAMAQDHGHTPDVCSVTNPDVCAHLGHMTAIDSSTAAEFVAHIMTPQNQQVDNLKITLWMPSMGHGSSPVEITQFGVNHYQVKNVYFIMPGQWEVRINFTLDQIAHQIYIPIRVTE